MSVRVYVPVTSSALADLVREGRLEGPLRAHAVTDVLREEWPDADEESYEFSALLAAGESSWGMRTAEDRPRRHVVAADVAAVVGVADEVTLVDVVGDLVWKRVAAAHVDTEDWDGVDFDDDLAWFATQEIAGLL